jgi:hypothetical protein
MERDEFVGVHGYDLPEVAADDWFEARIGKCVFERYSAVN